MASYTPNLNLIKPADADSYDVANDNGNMDKIDAAYGTLNSNIRTIHPTTELGTMNDLVSLISESASGSFVNCRIGATIVNKLCGVSARQGVINAFKANASSDYIEYTVIDTEAIVYSGYYSISMDTATYNSFNSRNTYSITLNSGWTCSNAKEVVKIGRVCILQFNGLTTSSTGSGWVTVGTVDENVTPSGRILGYLACDNAMSAGKTTVAECRINTNKTIEIYAPQSGTTYWGGFMYFCN